MRSPLFLLPVAFVAAAGFVACGDDETSTSSSGPSGPGSSNGGTGASGGNGAASSGGSSTGGGGSATGGTGGVGATGGGGGAPSTVDCSAAVGNIPPLQLTKVADIDRPVLAVSPREDTTRLFILAQHDGQIRIVENGNLLPTPFLDIGGMIATGNEQGLLGLAFHPGYANNGRFFIQYNASGGGTTTVMEYKRSADPNVADPQPVQLVVTQPTQAGNHNGGMLAFGADGFLYSSIGDGGPQNDPECDSQLPDNLLGKIIRLDVNGVADPSGYPAAAGNPNGAKFYHIGMRNPWRIAFDPCTDDLYIADVGQNAWEEVSVLKASDGPKNMGWPYREGAHDHNASNPCPARPAGIVEPVAEYSHNNGCSVTGGFVYRGAAIPGLRGTYFYGDYCDQTALAFKWDGNQAMQAITDLTNDLNLPGGLAAFGQDAAGEVYVCIHGQGAVYKITAE